MEHSGKNSWKISAASGKIEKARIKPGRVEESGIKGFRAETDAAAVCSQFYCETGLKQIIWLK